MKINYYENNEIEINGVQQLIKVLGLLKKLIKIMRLKNMKMKLNFVLRKW